MSNGGTDTAREYFNHSVFQRQRPCLAGLPRACGGKDTFTGANPEPMSSWRPIKIDSSRNSTKRGPDSRQGVFSISGAVARSEMVYRFLPPLGPRARRACRSGSDTPFGSALSRLFGALLGRQPGGQIIRVGLGHAGNRRGVGIRAIEVGKD